MKIPQYKSKRPRPGAVKYIEVRDMQWAVDDDTLPKTATVRATPAQARAIVNDWRPLTDALSGKAGCQLADYSAEISGKAPAGPADITLDLVNNPL